MCSVSGVLSPASLLIASLPCRTASSLASTTMPGARTSSTSPPRTLSSMTSSGPVRTALVRSSITSLHAVRSTLPPALSVTAETADGIIMAVEHQRLPIAAVQFHPESVMTLQAEIGMPIIAAVMAALPDPKRDQS